MSGGARVAMLVPTRILICRASSVLPLGHCRNVQVCTLIWSCVLAYSNLVGGGSGRKGTKAKNDAQKRAVGAAAQVVAAEETAETAEQVVAAEETAETAEQVVAAADTAKKAMSHTGSTAKDADGAAQRGRRGKKTQSKVAAPSGRVGAAIPTNILGHQTSGTQADGIVALQQPQPPSMLMAAMVLQQPQPWHR